MFNELTLSEMKDALHEIGYMARVYSLIKGVLLELEGTGRSLAAGHKAFQQLLCEVVDEVWTGKSDFVSWTEGHKATLSTALPDMVEENSSKASRLFQSRRRQEQVMPRSQSWLRGLLRVQKPGEDLDSSFATVKGPVSFPRQRRLVSLDLDITPGPGAYNPNIRAVKREPPRFRMPISGGRPQATETRSPGPAYYHPRKQFVST